MNLFVDDLFVNKTALMHNKKFKRILAASVLIFNEEFHGIVGNEPSGKYKDTTHNPFH